MSKVVRTIGDALVGLSLFAVAQTVRELALWELGGRPFAEESVEEPAIEFAGHVFTVADDQPVDHTSGQSEYEGKIQPLMDSHPMSAASRARVRRGPEDLGRYHLWYSAWLFRERASGRTTLWLARRLQPSNADWPRFEVTVVQPDGSVRTRVLRGAQLAGEYRLYRATQFVRQGTWSVLPLALGDVIGLFPLFLAIFPIGTFALGVWLIRRRNHLERYGTISTVPPHSISQSK